MNNVGPNAIRLFFLALMLGFFGCHRSPKPLPPSPPPAPTPTPAPTPEPTPLPTPTPEPTPAPTPTPNAPKTVTTRKPKPRHAPAVAKKPAPDTEKPQEVAHSAPPPKIVVQEGGTSASGAGQVSTDQIPDPEPQFTTDQLLERAETDLRNLKRELSAQEQSIAAQVHQYVLQSQEATKAGVLDRARHLALKAHLLAEDLVHQH